MATIASKIQWTTAAFAVAAAATLVPAAFADPTDPDTGETAGAAVGSSAGQAPSRSTRKDRDRPVVSGDAAGGQTGGSESTGTPAAGSSAGGATGEASPGRASTNVAAPSADATAPLVVGEDFTVIEGLLVADPDLQRATFGWLKDLDINACVLGLSQSIRGSESVAIGPYATSTLAFKTEGCG